MIKKQIIRYPKKTENFYFKKENYIFSANCKIFYRKNCIHSEIKLLNSDFKLIKKKMIYLTHFNLQTTRHKPGKKYLIFPIIKQGFFDGKNYRPPLLSAKFILAKCIFTKNNVNYNKLNKDIFKNSLSNIKNISSLKKAIVKRYSVSLPHILKRELIFVGVAITKLKIIKFSQSYKKIYIGKRFSKSKYFSQDKLIT